MAEKKRIVVKPYTVPGRHVPSHHVSGHYKMIEGGISDTEAMRIFKETGRVVPLYPHSKSIKMRETASYKDYKKNPDKYNLPFMQKYRNSYLKYEAELKWEEGRSKREEEAIKNAVKRIIKKKGIQKKLF